MGVLNSLEFGSRSSTRTNRRLGPLAIACLATLATAAGAALAGSGASGAVPEVAGVQTQAAGPFRYLSDTAVASSMGDGSVAVACPNGYRVTGGGGRIDGPAGDVLMTSHGAPA
ncbi:MAG: hypothetical protein AABM66_06275 [Actinomycetota bacterium]